jgi:hypothetical protein
MHKKFMAGLVFFRWLLLVSVLVGCGKGFDTDDDSQEEIEAAEYHAVLRPLNKNFGSYKGWAGFSITENQFWARVKVKGRKTKDMHAQYIHVGSRCPSLQDDSNGDGYLDFIEVVNASGPILIPLDSNLTTQMKGIFEFPRMRRQPFYYYSEACNLQWLIEDLTREDVISDDYMTKLPPKQRLNMDRRIVIIYGVDQERYLPSSVRTSPGYTSQFTFPIACGEIRRGRSDAFYD